jgi:hypothetical protein
MSPHAHLPIELYGTEASLIVPDPNMFGGEVKLAAARRSMEVVPTTSPMPMPITARWASPTWPTPFLPTARTGPAGEPRCTSSKSWKLRDRLKESRIVEIKTPVERPAPIAESLRMGRSREGQAILPLSKPSR